MEKEVGWFRYERVNPRNLIIPKSHYDELRDRAIKYSNFGKSENKCEPKRENVEEKLENLLEDIRITDESKLAEYQESQYQKCLEDADIRRNAIKEAKEKLFMQMSSSVPLKRGIGLSNVLKKNEELYALKVQAQEAEKQRNLEMDKMTIEAVEKNEKVRKKKDMQKTIDVAKFNVKLAEERRTEEKNKQIALFRERLVIEALTNDWTSDLKNKQFQRCVRRKQTNLENQALLKQKEELRQQRIHLEEMEQRENEIFLNYKKEMFSNANISNSKRLRDEHLRCINKNTQAWIKKLNLEGERDRKLREVCTYEEAWRKDDDRRKLLLKQKNIGLFDGWKQQIDQKLANRKEFEVQEKKLNEENVKVACEEKLENSKKLYEGCVKAREVEEYNMSKHAEKQALEAKEKTKRVVDEHDEMKAQLKARKQHYLEEARKQCKNVLPIKKVQC